MRIEQNIEQNPVRTKASQSVIQLDDDNDDGLILEICTMMKSKLHKTYKKRNMALTTMNDFDELIIKRKETKQQIYKPVLYQLM